MTVQASVHVSQPGNTTGLGDFLLATAQAGKPVGGIYALNANLKDTVNRNSPTTKLIYRRQTDAFNRLPNGFFEGDPVANATNWLTGIRDKADQNRTLIENWALNPADWYDPLNEPVVQLPPNPTPEQIADAKRKAEWLNTWMLTALEIAHQHGFKLALFSFPTGTPPLEIWQYLFPALRKGKEYGAILSLHEYSVYGSMQNPEGGNVLRYREVYKLLPEDCRIPFAITECGAGNGYDTGLSGQAWVNDLMYYLGETAKDTYVLFFCAFQLGGGESNMTSAMPAYTNAVVAFVPPVVVPPQPPTESASGTIIPPATKIVDSLAHTWTLGAQVVHGYALLRDGVQFGGGQGVLLLYYNHSVYTKNDMNQWFIASSTSWSAAPGDPRPQGKSLNIPWVGQNTALTTDDFSNSDCGPASTCMWLRFRGVNVTVDDVSRATGLPAGYTYTVFGDLDRAANKYGLNLKYLLGNMTLDKIKAEIDAGRPVILLVYYPALPVRYDPNYRLSHWIIVDGYTDTGIYYNDPYWLDAQHGKKLFMTNAQLATAMSQVSVNGNTSNQGIVEEFTTPPAVSTLSGVGAGARYYVTQQEGDAIKIAQLKTVLLLTLADYNEMRQSVQLVRSKVSGIDIVGRLFFPEDGVPFTPQTAIDYCRNGLRGLYDEGVREFQIGNEPNIYPGGMGWNWTTAAQFAQWFDQCLTLLKSQFPGCKWGYAALSPQPNTQQFFADSKWVSEKCDFVGVHAYWHSWSGGQWNAIDETGGMAWKIVGRQTSKPLYLTEYSCNTASVSYADKGTMYKNYVNLLRSEGRISKAFSFALSWPDQDANNEGWVTGSGRNQITDIPRYMVL